MEPTVVAKTKEQLVEEIKSAAGVIAKEHGKAALVDVNATIVPLVLDLIAATIPGQIDDMVINAAKPIIKDTFDSAIEGI